MENKNYGVSKSIPIKGIIIRIWKNKRCQENSPCVPAKNPGKHHPHNDKKDLPGPLRSRLSFPKSGKTAVHHKKSSQTFQRYRHLRRYSG
jgi:hypothetical protein